jgi:signal transduction histidine kinase
MDPRYLDYRESVPWWRAPIEGQAWREYGYFWALLLVAPVAFTYAVFLVSFTAGIAITVVGLFVSGWLVLAARGWGSVYRALGRALGIEAAAPAAYVAPKGFWRQLLSGLGDATGWRAIAFMVITFPLSILSFTASTVFLAVSAGAMTHWIWFRWLPEQVGNDGLLHRGASFGDGFFIEGPVRQAAFALSGFALAFLWPVLNRAFARLYARLTVTLLGPTLVSLRVASLEQSRGRAVEDADAKLRRIERDLHDGTQARLVAVAMQLGEAKEQLAAGDTAGALELVDTAHGSAKEALTELRELARGIHPPALDNGLGVALETLAARAPLPVTVDVDPQVELAPAVATIAYFCVAELITNAAKHARATGVYVLVQERQDGSVMIRVRDDGQGGARISEPDAQGRRSGLAGLAERVESVDGSLDILSPVGGPTVATIVLPTHA